MISAIGGINHAIAYMPRRDWSYWDADSFEQLVVLGSLYILAAVLASLLVIAVRDLWRFRKGGRMKISRWIVCTEDPVFGIPVVAHEPFDLFEAAFNWARVNIREKNFQIKMIEKEEEGK